MSSGRLGAGGGGAGLWQHLARGTASPLSRLRAASPTGGQAEDTEASHEALPHPLSCVKGCQGSGEILLEGGPSSVPSRTKNFAACGGDARCRRPEGTDAAPAICTCSAGTLPPPQRSDTHTLSHRTGTNSGGCLSATSAAAPSSTCASLMRSSTWSRRRWWPRAAAAVACSSRSSRRAAEWGAPGEVCPSLPASSLAGCWGLPIGGGDSSTWHPSRPSVDILGWCRHGAEALAQSPSYVELGGCDSWGSSAEQLTLLVATCTHRRSPTRGAQLSPGGQC